MVEDNIFFLFQYAIIVILLLIGKIVVLAMWYFMNDKVRQFSYTRYTYFCLRHFIILKQQQSFDIVYLVINVLFLFVCTLHYTMEIVLPY